MKIRMSRLRELVRLEALEEAGSKKPEKPKEPSDIDKWAATFYCPRHPDKGLVPSFMAAEKVEQPKQDPATMYPIGPMKPGQSRNVVPPTSQHPELRQQPKRGAARRVKALWCPMAKEPGDYGPKEKDKEGNLTGKLIKNPWSPDKGRGFACDYHVAVAKEGLGTYRPKKGIRYPMLGQVAYEEHAYGQDASQFRRTRDVAIDPKSMKELSPEERKEKGRYELASRIPPAIKDMADRMKAGGWHWKKTDAPDPEEGQPKGQPTFSQEKLRFTDDGKPIFTSDDIDYLVYYYPKSFRAAKSEQGLGYKGPDPYYFPSGKGKANIQQAFFRMGWDMTSDKRIKTTGAGMPPEASTLGASGLGQGGDYGLEDPDIEPGSDEGDIMMANPESLEQAFLRGGEDAARDWLPEVPDPDFYRAQRLRKGIHSKPVRAVVEPGTPAWAKDMWGNKEPPSEEPDDDEELDLGLEDER